MTGRSLDRAAADERPDDLGSGPRLIAQHDDDRRRRPARGRRPPRRRPGASSTGGAGRGCGRGARRATGCRPRSRRRRGPRTTTTSSDPGVADRVEDVLEDRPAVEAGKRPSGSRTGSTRPPRGRRRRSSPRGGSNRRARRRGSGIRRSEALRGLDHRPARSAVALGDDLGHDRERRLGRGRDRRGPARPGRAAAPARRRVTPASRSRSRRSPCVFCDPTAPT